MKYEIVEVELFGNIQQHVIVTYGDSCESFPVDETNPRYIQFLAELEETK